MKYYLAIDLGASSGRHVIGCSDDGEIKLEEIHRFITGMDDDLNNDKVWNLRRIFDEIKTGIKIAFSKYPNIESISIDTWGVDYVLLKGDQEVEPFYAYRNKRLETAHKEVEKVVSFERSGFFIAVFRCKNLQKVNFALFGVKWRKQGKC